MNENREDLIHALETTEVKHGRDRSEGMLDALYRSYCEGQGRDPDLIQDLFQQLNDLLSALPLKQQDPVVDVVCKLCSAHHEEAYKDGIRAGVRLSQELLSRAAK